MMVNEMEDKVAAIWAGVLEATGEIRPEDNFFELGGDSLAATIVLFQINEELGVELAPTSLLDAPTLTDFCALIGAARIGAPS
jgi:myxalamid-type nonribosomal peptide synthetase MxaA